LLISFVVETFSLLSNESTSQQIISDLSTEASAFKKAYSSSEKERRDLEQKFEKLKQETEQERHDMENKLRVGNAIYHYLGLKIK
jgi:predicted  nucleic acid-binding Zn-ribbon protein